jgi:signal transduction histidine kinase
MRTPLKAVVLVLAVILAAARAPGLAAAPPAAGTKHVLVLYSTSRAAPISVAGERDLPRILEQGLDQDLDQALAYYSEYIDQGRFPDPDYQRAFHDFLRVKYQGQRFDAIIVIQAAAIEFARKYQQQLFPDTPIVFLAVSPEPQRFPNSTGVVGALDLVGTVTLAAQLQPDLRNVFVVSGIGVPDMKYEADAREQLRPLESRFAITYLSGLPARDLHARLASLPEHSLVYYLVVYRDSDGEVFRPIEFLEQVSASARVPTYSWIDTAMGHGIVGGSLLDSTAMIDAVGNLTLRVLHGEPPDRIAISSSNLQVPQVDWRQLRRWGISERRVPAGTLIRFREESIWDRYRAYIVGAVALLLAQAMLIAGLLVQRARRRQAEEAVHHLGARLLTAQEAERSRIARELHDDIGQQLALLEIDLELLESAAPEKTNDIVDEVQHRVHSIAKSVSALSHQLHPAKLRLIGLVPALNGLQRDISRSDLSIRVEHENVPPALPPDLTLCLFRVAQEALQNALKYSRARQVVLRLRGDGDQVVLTIVDDGIGFDVDEAWGRGLGLISMGERVEALGGAIEIRSKPGAGTSIEARVPVRVSAQTGTAAV